jgi:flagellar M-ring protein FliF
MKKALANLSIRQRISIATVALLVGFGVYELVRRQREADFKPLFTGVSAEDAAAIVQKLKEGGIEFRLPDGGGSVLVPSARLAEVRLTLAAAGLPKTGRIGFELFDKTNLGATEFTEHINYRRALEGELERSVMAMAEVEQARVHLTFPKDSVFLDAQQPAKASVLVKTRLGARLSKQNVLAIDHLVASAVEGLSPDAVSVLDMNGNLLGKPKATGPLDGPEASEAGLEYRHKIEADLLAKINTTLEPLLGANKFKASVSVECDFTGGEQSEEIFDPNRSVMVSSQRTEDASTGAMSNGVPGTASALPRPTSRPGSSGKGLSRVTENITYQTSRTVKKTRMPAGMVRKMSLAVLLDQDVTWQSGNGGPQRVLVPPAPEKIKVLRELVAGITGFSAERGDQIVVESLPFETTLLLEPPTPPSPSAPAPGPASPVKLGLPALKLDQRTIGIAAGAAIGLGLLILIAARLLRWKKKAAKATAPSAQAELPAGTTTEVAPSSTEVAASREIVADEDIDTQLAERAALEKKLELQALKSIKLTPVITKTAEVLAKHLREKITSEPEVTAQVLRAWIREEEL